MSPTPTNVQLAQNAGIFMSSATPVVGGTSLFEVSNIPLGTTVSLTLAAQSGQNSANNTQWNGVANSSGQWAWTQPVTWGAGDVGNWMFEFVVAGVPAGTASFSVSPAVAITQSQAAAGSSTSVTGAANAPTAVVNTTNAVTPTTTDVASGSGQVGNSSTLIPIATGVTPVTAVASVSSCFNPISSLLSMDTCFGPMGLIEWGLVAVGAYLLLGGEGKRR
jgi:hypothetical protein